MKNVLKAVCLLFMVGVFALGFTYARNGGVTYEFEVVEQIENYTEKTFTSTVSKVVKNDTEAAVEQEFANIAVSQSYKSNVTFQQAEYRLIEEATGVKFSAAKKVTIDSIKGNVDANAYSWVEFTPEMSMIKGYIVKNEGEKQVKTYVEIAYPKADANGKLAGEAAFKTAAERPAEALK